jgi:hypothetical protein
MASFYTAEAGLEMASAYLQTTYETTGAPAATLPAGSQVISNAASVAYATTDDGPASMCRLRSGSFAGLHALVKTYTITSIGTSLIDGSQVRLTQQFECANIPLFQFAVFFMKDLWTQPAFNMNIDGRVHVNGDMHLQASKTLSFTDKVTCSGSLYHGFGYGSSNGDVAFTDADGNLVSMNQSGSWVDASDPDWYNKASNLWDGKVQDKAFGQEALNLPLTGGNDPHKLIERASGGNSDSYENKADLKIIDGVPYVKAGSIWTDISGMLPSGTITCGASTQFYDSHEKKYVNNTQIDMGKLASSGYFPSNGVIYVSDQRSSSGYMNGVSLVNGTSIGYPTTIASENPMYVEGDFNTVNKQPVAALTDAVTFLSNNWDNSLATSSSKYYNRKATQTSVNISFVTGDIAPSGTNYGGGLENLPRFLEDWNGTKFKIRGSMVEGWRSQQAMGTWRYIQAWDAYYSAPTRDWGFDTDLNDPSKLPPETPCVRVFQRTRWEQHDISYNGE